MKGIFIRKKFNVSLLLLFLSGLSLIGISIYLNIVDSEARCKLLILLITGIVIVSLTIASYLLNYGAFIHIDSDSIQAKYHLLGKIDCKISDVKFASVQNNTLIIQLKDGKCHIIMGIANPWALCSVIRRNMIFEADEQPKKLIEDLKKLESAKKTGIIYVCSGLALMFLNIFITVFLTGGRDINEFSKIDWAVMTVMGVVEAVTVIACFYLAHKAGKNNIPIEQTKYAIRRTVIETKPLLLGFVTAVYTDEDYFSRVTVFGYPNQNDVYYSVQEFDSEYNLINEYTSETYEDKEKLVDIFEGLIDITEKVLH